jgi:hypothetical protein
MRCGGRPSKTAPPVARSSSYSVECRLRPDNRGRVAQKHSKRRRYGGSRRRTDRRAIRFGVRCLVRGERGSNCQIRRHGLVSALQTVDGVLENVLAKETLDVDANDVSTLGGDVSLCRRARGACLCYCRRIAASGSSAPRHPLVWHLRLPTRELRLPQGIAIDLRP